MAISAASRIEQPAMTRAFMNPPSTPGLLREARPENRRDRSADPGLPMNHTVAPDAGIREAAPGTTLFTKDIRDRGRELVLRLVPALFEVLLPVLGPRTAVVIDESRIGRGGL